MTPLLTSTVDTGTPETSRLDDANYPVCQSGNELLGLCHTPSSASSAWLDSSAVDP
jgi:hypothetical protein